MQPKKVAIIGAGPSGLVTAKTLLHGCSPGTFAPIIFEKSHEIGGLWPSQQNGPRVGPVNPLMRTNLSRFTVAFSDFAWESVFEDSDSDSADDYDGVPMFPQAWQVRRYLEKYTERFLLPYGVLRLGERVLRTIRGMGGGLEGGWTVEWVTESCDDGNETQDQEVKSEQFDFLVVASGYFSSAHIPDIPGLHEFESRTIHSSSLHNPEDVQHFLQEFDTTTGKVVVIGGSMSGAEAASTLALHLSSSKSPGKNYQVHHICTRPFWTIPTYLPHEIPDPSSKGRSFLPLDLVMYDLVRRPPGLVEYTFGPVSSQQVKKVNGYFSSLLGSDYGKVGKISGHDERAEESSRPPWVAIGNDYAEYVRSGTISTTIGRVNSVHNCRDSNLATIDINLPSQGDDRTTTLNDVVAIVLATGFTPYNSLSFLPPQILSVLEYSETDPFFPIILDGKGTTHAEIPDIGFVGFYRGPYWGVMEMQARLIAKNWAHDTTFSEPELKKKEKERQSVRDLRSADPHLSRGQFSMGDYIGLMESFARELGMSRLPLAKDLDSEEEERSGPVVPARYTFASKSPNTDMDMDKDVTLHSLRKILSPEQTQMDTPPSEGATSTAIFRALHGSWRITRTYHHHRVTTQGIATFRPQYPSSPTYEKEYLYEESGTQHEDEEQTAPTLTPTNKSIYRLRLHNPGSKRNTPHILISSIDTTDDPNADLHISHGLNLATVAECGGSIAGGYTVCATGTTNTHTIATERGEIGADDTLADFSGCRYGYTYAFHFQGVAILSWECVAVKTGDEDHYSVRTVYERG